ncbi:MAG: ComEC/Rec2 family competence protein [Candidatus Gracilibacteria bacterium]|nr:ComEC/Rec2 family competence protein [Candidatus Gracilibacteria bacterium]MDD3120503.1 ComEC/Rec2 family competence protein [Candidatus Gracilibacteria bacterium]
MRFKEIWICCLIGIFGIICGFGISQINLSKIEKNTEILSLSTDNFYKKVIIEGKIDVLQKITENNKSFVLKVNKIDSKNFEDRNLNLLIYVSPNLNLAKGDIIKFNSKIDKIKNSQDFQYDKYLLLKDVYASSYVFGNEKIGYDLNSYSKFTEYLKSQVSGVIEKMFPQKSASLLAGMLIGERVGMDKQLSDNFSKTGLTHIIAVSGFNITIVIAFCAYLFLFLPSIVRKILITVVIVIFVGIVGEQAPVIRASINGLIAYYFLTSGKQLKSFSILLFITLVYIIRKPLSINYDISFHLSYLAVIGILYLEGFFKKMFFFLPEKFAIREGATLTMSSLVITLPITVVNFGQLSLVSIITNTLIGPVLPILMFIGTASVVGFFINKYIGIFLGFFTRILLEYIIKISEFFGGLSMSTVQINLGDYKILFEIGYFMILVFLIVYFRKKEH